MGELRISLLGSFQASVDGRTLSPFRTSKVQALLIYLVVEAVSNPAALHPREALMDLLWSRLPLKSAQDNLRRTLYLLRKAIPGYETNGNQGTTEFIVSNRLSIGLNPDYRYYLDVADFCQQLHLNKLEEAAALYRGDFLVNFYLTDSAEFETWATAWRAKLRRQALDALDHLTIRRLEQGHFSQAQRYARQQIAIDDLRESAYCQLMEALARSGQRASALEHYKICRRRLAEDLGIDLSQETKMLSQRIEADQIPHPDAIAHPDAATMPGRITEQLPVARAADSDGEEATLTIFVERKRELRWLGEALTGANAGQGQLRFVIGGAGRGKTTLVSEFARRALNSDPDLIVVTGYCRGQTGYRDPYAPFREILAQLSGDVNTALATREQGRRLVSTMPRIIPLLVTQAPDLVGSLIPVSSLRQRAAAFSSSESPWFQQLCAQQDAPYRHNLQQDRLFSQFGTTLKSIAAEKHLLLILEDLHLADPTSVALLYHLGQEIGGSPILLLGTYRPEEIAPIWGEKKHPLANISGELKRQHGDIWLDLSETTTAEERSFVDALLDSAPNRLDASFRASFCTHTGGHPLFSVELLNALQERGDLVQDENGRWLAGQEIDWHTLPARVEGVIEQRLGRLDADLQSALNVASVEGETFTAEVVASVQKQDKRLMVRRLSREAGNLHRLVKVEALASAGGQRLSRYRFRHHLFQQHLYDCLDETERAYLHEDVGRALEDLYRSDGAESAASLAWHFKRAGMPKQALEYLIQAARQAIRLGANDQVIEHCTSGLNILKCATDSAQNVQRELTLETMLGIAFIASRGYGSPEAGAAFKRAQELYQQGEQTTQLFPILLGLWGYHIHRADYQLARELAGQAFVLARQQQELGPLLVAHKMMGMTLFYIGEYALSLEHMEQVIHNYDPDLHSELGFLFGSDPVLSAFCTAALNLMYMGYPDQALTYNRKALQLARDLSYPFALAFTLLFVLWLHTVRNDPQAVLEIVEEQITLTGEQGFPLQLAIAEYDEYWARGLLGEAVESILPMRRALADWEATGAQLGKTALLGGLAQVSKEASQIEDGLAFLAAAVGHGERTGERYYESDQYRIRGELKWAHGASNHDVEADFRRAINVARQLNARLPQLRATIALCRLWQQQERKEEARRALAEIYGWFSEGFDEPTLVEARQLLQTLA